LKRRWYCSVRRVWLPTLYVSLVAWTKAKAVGNTA
jgi:hypothetical protein